MSHKVSTPPLAAHVRAAIAGGADRSGANPRSLPDLSAVAAPVQLRPAVRPDLATHVQASIAAGRGAKGGGVQAKPVALGAQAAHVRAAITATMQPKLAATGRAPFPAPWAPQTEALPVAPHVQAALGAAAGGHGLQPRAPAVPGLAPHVAAVLGRAGAVQLTPARAGLHAGGTVVQAANAYDEERNEGDIEHGLANFKTIKKGLTETQTATPAGMYNIWTVDAQYLPQKVQNLIAAIQQSNDVYWGTKDAGLRDFHSNNGGHLPERDPAAVANAGGRQQDYYDNAWGDNDKQGRKPQYAEYHITQSGLGKGFRLLYDYVNDDFYITISHYNIWHETYPPFFKVV